MNSEQSTINGSQAGGMFMLRSSAILTILFTLLVVCSCANPAADKPKAVTSEAAPVSSSLPAVKAEEYSITPDNSKIEFVASKVTGAITARLVNFLELSASLANPKRAA